MLTTGIDTLTGTSGNDTFTGSFDGAATSTSNLGDTIDGGNGTDTVKIYSNAATVLPNMTNVENLWVNDTIHGDINASAIAGLTSLELNGGSTANGATVTYTMGAGQTLKVSSVTDGDAANNTVGDGGITVAAASAAVTSQAIELNAVGAQAAASAVNALDFDITGTGVATASIKATGANNITLNNAGGALANVTVTGAGSLTMQAPATAITTITNFDASAATGAVSVNLSANTGANQTIKGGSAGDTFTVDLARNITLDAGAGNDTVTLANPTAGNLSSTSGSADSIKGGDGTDTLVLTAAGADALDGDDAADRAVITGFEQLRISDDLNAVTVNAANISGGVNYVQLGADTTTANGTITGVTTGATIENRANTHAGHTLTVGGTFEAGDIFNFTVNGTALSYTVLSGDTNNDGIATAIATAINTSQGAGTASSAGAVVTLTTSTATAFTTTETGGGAADAQTATLATGDAIETDITMTGATGAGTPDDLLNIKLNGDITNNDDVESAYGVAGINKLVITTADRDNTDGATDRNDGYVMNLTNDNNVSQMTISGTHAFAFTSTASTAALGTVTATDLAGDFALNLTTNGLTQGVTITGGSGTNTIVATGFGDIITGGSRADTITGGNGADIFVFGAGSSGGMPSATVFDTITDFAKASDVIRGAQTFTVEQSATASTGVAAINAEGIASFNGADDTLAEKIIAVNAGINAGTESAGDFAIFEDNGNSYVFIHDGTTALGAGDVLIKLTGVTGLSDSTISTTDLTIA